MAETVCFNAKVQRPGVCNAMETLLVHEAVAPGLPAPHGRALPPGRGGAPGLPRDAYNRPQATKARGRGLGLPSSWTSSWR